jgi:beta-lactamase class D
MQAMLIPASLLFCVLFTLPLDAQPTETGDVFTRNGVEGAFVISPVDGGNTQRINPDRCAERFIPASTFKILNSLIALESGAVENTEEVLTWDGRTHRIRSWNQDQDMAHAFQRSCVWFYQEVARRIGAERMQHYVNACAYGNADLGGGIDRFWLDGDLRISCDEQITLLRALWKDDLPFRAEVQRTVKKLMVLENGDGYVLSGKTGLGDIDGTLYGWLVGYIVHEGTPYCYALNIASSSMEMREFARLRHRLVRELLTERGLMQGKPNRE